MRVDVLLRGIFFHRASNYVHYSPDAIILILDATGRVIKVYLVEVKAPYALRYILEKFDNEAGSTTWYQGPIRFPVYGYHALPGGVSHEESPHQEWREERCRRRVDVARGLHDALQHRPRGLLVEVSHAVAGGARRVALQSDA